MNDIQIWYRAYSSEIIPVSVVKASDKMLTLQQTRMGKNIRNAIRSDFYNYFRTWQEAKDFLLTQAQGRIERAERELQIAQQQMHKVTELREASE